MNNLDRLRALHAAATEANDELYRQHDGHEDCSICEHVTKSREASYSATHNALPSLLACVDALRALVDAPREIVYDLKAVIVAARIHVSDAQIKAAAAALAPLLEEQP